MKLACWFKMYNNYTYTYQYHVIHVYPPAVGVGDPHYKTFDRPPSTYYHFQGRGTHSTLDVLNEEGNIVFALQGRQGTGECPPRGATWHTGIAFGEPNILSYQVCYCMT